MQNEDRLRELLSNLGRSTLRGVRKCPKCGTYNGTRGLSCKNKACDVVFKTGKTWREGGDKRKQSMEVCKLDTGTSTQVFSVRVRDKGPDYRGFVQLPIIHPEESYLTQVSALCFVESCQRLFNTSILKCHERDDEVEMSVATCQHIQSALRCCANAQPLNISDAAMATLNITSQVRQGVWELSSGSPGPLVQRVSKSIMVVKCRVSTKHPLGFLHVAFFPRPKDPHSTCGCKGQQTLLMMKNCVHYYACIAAFVSDPKMEEEFSQFVDKERLPTTTSLDVCVSGELESILGEQCVVEVDPGLFLNKNLDLPQELEGLVEELQTADSLSSQLATVVTTTTLSPPETLIKVKGVKRKKEVDADSQKNKLVKKGPIRKQLKLSHEKMDVTKVQQTFLEWLSSVTERINQTMHFQLDGKPPPLVFLTPHVFFDCLMERVVAPCMGVGRRRRLPNRVTTVRRQTPPLGLFHCYTWHISNILHAKAIFDTPLMVLNVTRSFVRNPDGTYDECEKDDTSYQRREGEPSIRPAELKTYLKIGKTSPEQTIPGLLSIDWTPDLLPASKMGQLEITFEFGHTPLIQ